jgi:HPt (histidine-containing phosphotransfer) domain-containing protein
MGENVIDRTAIDRLLEVIGGDREDLAELIDDFRSETPRLLTRMQAAAASQDLGELRIVSHSLKSNGRDFGAIRLTALCEQLEHACRDGAVDDPQERVDAIGRELETASEALSRLLPRDE